MKSAETPCKLFIGPVSKNVVDAVIEHANDTETRIGIIPSRRQIDCRSGYVNSWFTGTFAKYIRSNSDYVVIERDHGGPGQGKDPDNGLLSMGDDCKHNFDMIHIDPWLKYKKFESGLRETIRAINYAHNINQSMSFEIGTEEAIRKSSPIELQNMIEFLYNELSETSFNKIRYVVVQSGTGLDLVHRKNTGTYDPVKLHEMASVVHDYGFMTKEHNGDFLSPTQISNRFGNGLDAINIAPEFGMIETETILDNLSVKLFKELKVLCLSRIDKWNKWVNPIQVPSEEKIVRLAGHYVFSTPQFAEIKSKLDPDIDNLIKDNIKKRIKEIENETR